jgi:hypothetical protein
MISFCLILTVILVFVSIKYKYDKDVEIENILRVRGSWIRSAKNMRFVKDTLCADLRTNKTEIHNEGDLTFEGFLYNRACYLTCYYPLGNENGYFGWDLTNRTYSHKMTYPKGSWIETAQRITYFPNSVCAFFLDLNKNIYVEDCIDYDENDFLVNENGKFAIILKH